jgi:threonine/homoserine/homoserine lactone efflux protein
MVSREKMEDYFYLGIFLIAMLFALISVFGLYTAINRLISTWFNSRYQPIFDALFSLTILAISIYLIRERLIKR